MRKYLSQLVMELALSRLVAAEGQRCQLSDVSIGACPWVLWKEENREVSTLRPPQVTWSHRS